MCGDRESLSYRVGSHYLFYYLAEIALCSPRSKGVSRRGVDGAACVFPLGPVTLRWAVLIRVRRFGSSSLLQS